jgi:hypothetical protein
MNFRKKTKNKQMNTLIASRDYKGHLNCVTTLKDSEGFVKAVLTGYQQPKKSQKTIMIRNENFNLKFN